MTENRCVGVIPAWRFLRDRAGKCGKPGATARGGGGTRTDQDDVKWVRLLKRRTAGRDDSRADLYHYPYEPTPYCVLERLAGSGLITKKNRLVDYGCGKGRVDFFMSCQTRCRSVGVEYDERIFHQALKNRETAVSGGRTEFVCGSAEMYQPPEDADRFYFFNPFAVEAFRKVLGKIKHSFYENPREILLFFYYPSDEYRTFLMTAEELSLRDEIDCRNLFAGNDRRESVLIFELIG